MGTETAIQWTHHTYNAWRGCEKVSPGCDNCYAEAMSHRNPEVLGYWGKGKPRPQASESYWRHPMKWNREAAAAGERRRVFCSSLSDVFEDREDLDAPRSRLLETIEKTPHLDWLLLTKRPEKWRTCFERLAAVGVSDGDCLAEKWLDGEPLPNIWLGVSVEDQQRADERIPALLEIPAALRFLSMEPLLEAVDVSPYLESAWCAEADPDSPGYTVPGIDWVIVGGESGSDARPCDLAWIRSIRDQCREAGVPVFVKQLGADIVMPLDDREVWPGGNGLPGSGPIRFDGDGFGRYHVSGLKDKKGGDPSEWPEDLRVREFPIPKGGAA